MVNNYDSFFLVVQYTFNNDELAQKNSQGHQSTSISTCTFGINDIHFTRSTSAMMRGRVIITNYFSSGAVASAGEKAQKLYGFYTHTSSPLLLVRVGTCPPPFLSRCSFLLLVKGNLFSSSLTRWVLAPSSLSRWAPVLLLFDTQVLWVSPSSVLVLPDQPSLCLFATNWVSLEWCISKFEQ